MNILELYKCANPKACALRAGGGTSPSRTHPLVLASEHFLSTPPFRVPGSAPGAYTTSGNPEMSW